MRNAGVAVVLAGVVGGGCVWESHLDRRPARMELGVMSRRVSVPTPPAPGTTVNGLARTTTGTPTETAPSDVAMWGGTGSVQFTMSYPHHVYVGGEIEAGPMEHSGSYLGGAYGVLGAETTSHLGTLSVEAVAGRRWLRYDLDSEDVPTTVLEPRVRGQVWVSDQITLGGLIGASAMPGESGWMAGVFLGMYSNEHGNGR